MKIKRLICAVALCLAAIFTLSSCDSLFIFDIPRLYYPNGKTLVSHYLDVGQGDSIFIELPNGETMLIDSGENYHGASIIKYIEDCGRDKIDYLVGTHPHSDHIGSMAYIVRNIKIGSVYMPKVATNTVMYEKLLEAVEKNEYYRYCYDICRYHHEKWDGTGYPEGLVGDEIPIWAQVGSLADCYDALTSERPYKTAYSHETAVEMIRTGACGAFSDEMMDCFGAALPKMKELAIRYADQSSADHSRKDIRKPTAVQDASREPKKDIYLKMDRNDLIDTIEHQKTILEEYRKRDREVLEKQSDYVIEFDLKNDLLHERKGSMKALCGYHV